MMVRRLMIFLIIMSFPNYTTDWLEFFHSKYNYSNKKLSFTTSEDFSCKHIHKIALWTNEHECFVLTYYS